jgi:Family of unknown function (DUF6275)
MADMTVEGVRMPNGDLNRMKTAKKVVANLMNEDVDTYGPPIGKRDGTDVTTDDIYVVWFCKTLQNWKALLSSDVVDSGIYFEVTYNGDKGELYLDFYEKSHNRAITVT